MSIRTRFGFFTAIVLGLFYLAACCSEDPYVRTAIPPQEGDSVRQAYLRFVVADPEIEPVDVLLDGSSLFCESLGFLEFPEDVYEAQFWPVDTSATELSFRTASGTTLASTPVTLRKGTYQTAYLFKENGTYRIVVTHDDPRNVPGKSELRYRVINLAVGSPSVDVYFINNQNTSDVQKISNLGYGDTTAFLIQSVPPLTVGNKIGKRLIVINATAGDTIIDIPSVTLYTEAVATIAMVGRISPKGEQKFIHFAVFQDSFSDQSPKAYCNVGLPVLDGPIQGKIPLLVEIIALRFLNATSSADSTLDLMLQDSIYGTDFPDRFRNNYPGQQEAVIGLAPLGTDPSRSLHGYFFLSRFLQQSFPFRIEINKGFTSITSPQTVLVPQKPFRPLSSRRYTVVAYGPAVIGQAGSVLLEDRTPEPPAGMVGLRFFHGGWGANQMKQLRIRVSGTAGPLMNYGEAPDPITQSFNASASGSNTIEVVDQSGAVVYSQSGITLQPDRTYLILLSMGPRGEGPVLTAVSEEVVQ